MHSLELLDTLTSRDLAYELIEIQLKHESNTPTKDFWKALMDSIEYYTLDMIEQFVKAVNLTPDDGTAIPKNMWILNRIRDDMILGANSKPGERLLENSNLIMSIWQLSSAATKRLSSWLAYANEEEKSVLHKKYLELHRFIRFADKEALKQLDFVSVKKLLTASKTQKPKDTPTPDDDPITPSHTTIESKDLDKLIIGTLVNGDEEEIKNLKDLLDEMESRLVDPGTERDDTIDNIGGIFKGKSVKIPKISSSIRSLVGRVCNTTCWGGVLETEEKLLIDAVSSDSTKFRPFDPNDNENSLTGFDSASLFEFICGFDDLFKHEGMETTTLFSPIISRLNDTRSMLVERLDIIMYKPIFSFGYDDNLRIILFNYISAWGDLFQACKDNHEAMCTLSPTGGKYVSKAILLLDTLFIRTSEEWKGIIMPLHPIFLWRYCEIIKTIQNEKDMFSPDDIESLKEGISQLPQMLNVIVASDLLTGDSNIILPCSGSIEMLPTFENKVNRYIGNDGVRSIAEILARWVGFSPFSKNEVRLATIDVPEFIILIRSIKKFMDNTRCERVIIDSYITRNQNINNELSKLDYSGEDYEIGEYIRTKRLLIRMHSVTGPSAVKEALRQKPVHVAIFFDQSKYTVDFAPVHKNLYITPLVVTYDYVFDKRTHRGTITPSSDMGSGIIGDYHRVMENADVVVSDMNARTTYSETEDISDIITTIEEGLAQWLVVADRSTTNYAPPSSIPIGEELHENRTVCIWASENSRIIDDYMDRLREYNLYPKKETLVNILRKFGHIASCGHISIPRYGESSQAINNNKKALLGTLFAAAKYTRDYENKLPLVASLDTGKARNWLYEDKKDKERADLIGMNYDKDSNTLYIHPIEVKTRDDSTDAHFEKHPSKNGWIISEHAADQIASVIKKLEEIFGIAKPDSHDMFISARREVLKYQIVSECFRKTHAPDTQARWEEVFRKAFGNGKTGNINIVIYGLLYHFDLSKSSGYEEKECIYAGLKPYKIIYYHITTKEIQDDILGDVKPFDEMLIEIDAQKEQKVDESSSTEELSEIPDTISVRLDNTSLESMNVKDNDNISSTSQNQHNELNMPSDDSTTQNNNKSKFSNLENIRLLLGEDTRSGEKIYWEFGNKNLNNRHLLINGNSGCGKTYCIQALLMETALQGVSSVVFDYTGGFANSKLDTLFKEKLKNRIKQRIVRVEKIPINPFKKHEIQLDEDLYLPENDVDIASKIAEIFSAVYALGDQQKSSIYSAVLSGVRTFGENMNFAQMVSELENIGTNYAKTVISKIQSFSDINPFTYDNTFDWGDIRDSEGSVFIFQLGGYTRDIQLLLTELLLWDVWSYCVKNGDEHKPFILVLDEAQNLSHGEKSPSAKILTEGRKYGLSGWYATQFMKPQLSDDEIQRLQQAGQKLYFCPPDEGIVTVAKNIDITTQGTRDWSEKLMKLKKGECVTCGSMVRSDRWVRYEPRVIKITSLPDRA